MCVKQTISRREMVLLVHHVGRFSLGTWTRAQLLCFRGFSASFAKWRWGTLHTCCQAVLSVEFLSACWEAIVPSLKFAASADAAVAAAVDSSMRSVVFWRRTKLVSVLAARSEHARTWGSGCACHEEECKLHKVVSCDKKGREQTSDNRVARKVL